MHILFERYQIKLRILKAFYLKDKFCLMSKTTLQHNIY